MSIVQGSYSQATRTRRLWTAYSTSSSTTTGTTWERCSHQNKYSSRSSWSWSSPALSLQNHQDDVLQDCASGELPVPVIPTDCDQLSSEMVARYKLNQISLWSYYVLKTIDTTIYHHRVHPHHWDPSWAFSNNLLWAKTPSNVTTVQIDVMPRGEYNSIQAFPSFCSSSSAQSAKN